LMWRWMLILTQRKRDGGSAAVKPETPNKNPIPRPHELGAPNSSPLATMTLLSHLPISPRVRPLHAYTYLFAVPLFSISFLVFLNSSLSFLLTNIFHVPSTSLGNIVGTLGFVDELVVIVAAPLWGVISDGRLGTRGVTVVGYGCIAISLLLSVTIHSVYPGLIFSRIVFAIGSAAVTTMVSAILPEMTNPPGPRDIDEEGESRDPPTGRLAGMVGMFTGVGALLALGVFLPLPTKFSKLPDVTHGKAVEMAYSTVAAIAVGVAVWCAVGLPPPTNPAEDTWASVKKWVWTKVWGGDPVFVAAPEDSDSEEEEERIVRAQVTGLRGLQAAALLAIRDGRIGVAYVGGFVARASSVGVSLFIPLFVNHWFISTGRCLPGTPGLEKDECRKAYILASSKSSTPY
jgi:MFS family permease